MRAFAGVVTLLVVLSLAAGVHAVPVATYPNGVEQSRTTSLGDPMLVVEGYRTTYDGENVSAFTVVVNNTGQSLTADVTVRVVGPNGQTRASGATLDAFVAPGRNEYVVSLDAGVPRRERLRTEITVEKTM